MNSFPTDSPRVPFAFSGEEPAVDFRHEILYEDANTAVLAKSGNLPCHPSGRYRHHTAEGLLRREHGYDGVHFVSRLDRETSGCVLMARTPEAAAWYGKEMMRHRISKEYLCIARGDWEPEAIAALAIGADGAPESPAENGSVDLYGRICAVHDEIVHKSRRFERWYSRSAWEAVSNEGHEAACTRIRRLSWESVGVDGGRVPGYVLLACEPLTGRTHQIRATIRGVGLEVVGDKLYGPDRTIYARLCEGRMTEADRAVLRLDRQALHAWRLRFRLYGSAADAPLLTTEASPARLLADFVAACARQ